MGISGVLEVGVVNVGIVVPATLGLLAAAGLGQSQWPMSSSKKSNILTKAKLHTYVEL